MKELIYTGIFILLGIVLIVLLISMFTPKKSTPSPAVETKKQEALYLAPLETFDQNSNTATPYGGSGYEIEYFSPSHSPFTAL